jgi:myosin-7
MQMQDERNYHIFYCILVGLNSEEKGRLELTDAKDYFYLTQGGSITCDGRDDIKDYADILDAMKVLNFNKEEIFDLFRILAAVLHMGGITYQGTSL